ncbi:MAG: aldehyde dehydrogenase family protein [Rhizobiaceae bacterium]|jgi:aldehyde dehydrogenase (NAD+)|nr:aldehyde dehydrogenase family protein [Rhizobiaceae bacterium]
MKTSQFYIDGKWVAPSRPDRIAVINPATEDVAAEIAAGGPADADRAVQAAVKAFATFSRSTKAERLALLRAILAAYRARAEDLAQAVTTEMGAPLSFSRSAQVWAGEAHLEAHIAALEGFAFEKPQGRTTIVFEPVGVCGLITPWNWPLNQIVCKVAPALAAGCTMVLKPSEISPLSGLIFAEIMHAAGVPAGVFNLVNGDGPSVGEALARHPNVDMISFTGSTRAGILVAKAAADTVKRVAQELGGKSPNVILDDADLEAAVTGGVQTCFANTGQSCDAPTRMLVPRALHAEALEIAAAAAKAHVTGDPRQEATVLGPVVSKRQFDKIQGLIQTGIDEGATLVAGGAGRPNGLNRGFYVKPTVFGDVTPDMTIAREEIFGPVLAIMPYDSEAEAIRIANDTPYGLSSHIQSGSLARARAFAAHIRSGVVNLGYPDWDLAAPFGGFKQSGNGREYSTWGMHDFLEAKSVIGPVEG